MDKINITSSKFLFLVRKRLREYEINDLCRSSSKSIVSLLQLSLNHKSETQKIKEKFILNSGPSSNTPKVQKIFVASSVQKLPDHISQPPSENSPLSQGWNKKKSKKDKKLKLPPPKITKIGGLPPDNLINLAFEKDKKENSLSIKEDEEDLEDNKSNKHENESQNDNENDKFLFHISQNDTINEEESKNFKKDCSSGDIVFSNNEGYNKEDIFDDNLMNSNDEDFNEEEMKEDKYEEEYEVQKYQEQSEPIQANGTKVTIPLAGLEDNDVDNNQINNTLTDTINNSNSITNSNKENKDNGNDVIKSGKDKSDTQELREVKEKVERDKDKLLLIKENHISSQPKQSIIITKNDKLINKSTSSSSQNQLTGQKGKIEQVIKPNKKLIIDDEEEFRSNKSVHINRPEKSEISKIQNQSCQNNIKKSIQYNPLVIVKGTKVQFPIDSSFFIKSRHLTNKPISPSTNHSKSNSSLTIHNNHSNHNNRNSMSYGDSINKKRMNNNIINNSSLNNNLLLKKRSNENAMVPKVETPPKKEYDLLCLSMLDGIVPKIQTKYTPKPNLNFSVSFEFENIKSTIVTLGKVETKLRIKLITQKTMKLLFRLFNLFENSTKPYSHLLDTLNILDIINTFQHRTKIQYLKEKEIPLYFTVIKIAFKYIYSLFKIKMYDSKYLKEIINQNEDKSLIKFAKIYKSYMNATSKLKNLIEKSLENDKTKQKSYEPLLFYLEYNPNTIKYSRCFKLGKKFIEFIFEYISKNK